MTETADRSIVCTQHLSIDLSISHFLKSEIHQQFHTTSQEHSRNFFKKTGSMKMFTAAALLGSYSGDGKQPRRRNVLLALKNSVADLKANWNETIKTYSEGKKHIRRSEDECCH